MVFWRRQSVAVRFWRSVDRDIDQPSCWLWTGSRGTAGYGKIFIYDGSRRSGVQSHRLSWVLSGRGPIPPGMHVCHRCDEPLCVNPAHLFLGTDRDNTLDASRKKRHWRSAKTHCLRGHPLGTANIRGKRDCRPCDHMRRKECERRKKAGAGATS